MAGQQYKAKYDCKSTGEGTLSFKTGDQFSLVRKTNKDWWTMRSMSGDEGLAPMSYLEAVNYMQAIGSSVKTATYTTLYDYVAQGSNQLSFQHGETLLLVDKTDVSWWTMKSSSSGNQGLVPVNYIDKLDTVEEKKADNTDGPTVQVNGTFAAQESVLLSIDTQIQKIHDTAAANDGSMSREQRATLQKLIQHRQTYIDSQKTQPIQNHTPSSPVKAVTQASKSPLSSPKLTKKVSNSPRAKRKAPPPPTANNSHTRLKSESDQVVRRENHSDIKSLKDNRYSLQPDSSALNNSDSAFKNQFGSLPRRSAPAPPNRQDSLSSSNSVSASKPPVHPSISSPQKTASSTSTPQWTASTSSLQKTGSAASSPQKATFKEADLNGASTFSPNSSTASSYASLGRRYSADPTFSGTLPQSLSASPPRRTASVSAQGSNTMEAVVLSSRKRSGSGSSAGGSPKYSRSRSSSKELVLQAPPIPELPKSFPKSDGGELVESIRKRTAISYRKTLVAITGVLEFLKDKVPDCSDMVDGLMTAISESQAEKSPSAIRKVEGSSDLDRLRDIFFEITECKNDSQQRGWAVHDDQQAIVDVLEELLQILCDANPEISKAAVEEDKYENVLTLITYYQMENRLQIRLLLLKVFGVLCGLDQTVVSVLLSSVLPNELGRDIQQDLNEIQKTLYSCTVGTMIFSTAEAVPLPVYDQWSEDYVLFLLETIENPLLDDEEERVSDAFLNMILSFNQHFPDPSTNLVMKAVKRCSNPRNFSEKLVFLVNRGEDPVAISKPCCPDSMTKFLLDLFSDKDTAGLFYTTDMMVLIDIVSRQLADLGPEEEARVHYLELLFRIVATTNYSEHKHRQHEIIASLNRIAQEENAEGTPDCELVRKIWRTYPGIFEEITDL